MSTTKKPSEEANTFDNTTEDPFDTTNGIIIGKLIFAASDELQTSVKEASRKTEIFTLSERLNQIEKIMPIPTLNSSNFNHYCQSIQRFIRLSDTAVVFLSHSPTTKAGTLWSA